MTVDQARVIRSFVGWFGRDPEVERIELDPLTVFLSNPNDAHHPIEVALGVENLLEALPDYVSSGKSVWPDLPDLEAAWRLLSVHFQEAQYSINGELSFELKQGCIWPATKDPA